MLDSSNEANEGSDFASIGKPITSINIRTAREDGVIAGSYEVANLELSGHVVFKKHYNDPGVTKKNFTHNGGYLKGERAYVDSHGKVNMTEMTREKLVINGVQHLPTFKLQLKRHRCPASFHPMSLRSHIGQRVERPRLTAWSMNSTPQKMNGCSQQMRLRQSLIVLLGSGPLNDTLNPRAIKQVFFGKPSRQEIQSDFD